MITKRTLSCALAILMTAAGLNAATVSVGMHDNTQLLQYTRAHPHGDRYSCIRRAWSGVLAITKAPLVTQTPQPPFKNYICPNLPPGIAAIHYRIDYITKIDPDNPYRFDIKLKITPTKITEQRSLAFYRAVTIKHAPKFNSITRKFMGRRFGARFICKFCPNKINLEIDDLGQLQGISFTAKRGPLSSETETIDIPLPKGTCTLIDTNTRTDSDYKWP